MNSNQTNFKTIFLIADPHFGHSNMLTYESRPFKDVKEQDEVLINNWNKIIKPEYFVYMLGDISFYPKEITKDIINKLNGRKILIYGNHDRRHSVKYFYDIGFEIVSKYPICIENNIWLSHEPMYLDANTIYKNIYGHIHSYGINTDRIYCVSVEKINYIPIRLDKIIKFWEKERIDN